MGIFKKRLNRWDRIMAAISFAEAGEIERARDLLGKRTGSGSTRNPGQRKRLKSGLSCGCK